MGTVGSGTALSKGNLNRWSEDWKGALRTTGFFIAELGWDLICTSSYG